MSFEDRLLPRLAVLASIATGSALAASPAKLAKGQLRWLDPAGKIVLAVAANGLVTDASGRSVARLDDREGTFRMLIPKEGPPFRFRDDPAILRKGNRYELRIYDKPVFEVEEDGTLKVNGVSDGRVEGYDRDPAVRDRFSALLAILPVVPPAKADAPLRTDGGSPTQP